MHARWAQTILYILAVVVIAVALKWHYSTSNVNELRWILAPTAFVVETISGIDFQFESYSGYMSDDHTFLIAAPCAGVNFLIVCFLMLAGMRVCGARLEHLPVMLLAAYAWTVPANAVRILIALEMRSGGAFSEWAEDDVLHRVEGILVYFTFLILLCVASNKLGKRQSEFSPRARMGFVALPLLAYYAVAFAMPIVNGSYDPASKDHFLSVLTVPLIVWLPFAAIVYITQRLRKTERMLTRRSVRRVPDQVKA